MKKEIKLISGITGKELKMDLVGRTIKQIRLMTTKEMELENWEGNIEPVVLVLDDGTLLYPSGGDISTSEGCLFGIDSDGLEFTIMVK